MEEFMKEYGGAVKKGAVLIGITALVLYICNPADGGIALEQFRNAFTNFFTKMNALS